MAYISIAMIVNYFIAEPPVDQILQKGTHGSPLPLLTLDRPLDWKLRKAATEVSTSFLAFIPCILTL